MKNNAIKSLFTERFKYPLLILLLGIFLMLLPVGKSETDSSENNTPSLAQILSCTKGVGECKVLVSDKGVVVVCEGADNAKVRLEIIQALSSYTGYSSDKISILKMVE